MQKDRRMCMWWWMMMRWDDGWFMNHEPRTTTAHDETAASHPPIHPSISIPASRIRVWTLSYAISLDWTVCSHDPLIVDHTLEPWHTHTVIKNHQTRLFCNARGGASLILRTRTIIDPWRNYLTVFFICSRVLLNVYAHMGGDQQKNKWRKQKLKHIILIMFKDIVIEYKNLSISLFLHLFY